MRCIDRVTSCVGRARLGRRPAVTGTVAALTVWTLALVAGCATPMPQAPQIEPAAEAPSAEPHRGAAADEPPTPPTAAPTKERAPGAEGALPPGATAPARTPGRGERATSVPVPAPTAAAGPGRGQPVPAARTTPQAAAARLRGPRVSLAAPTASRNWPEFRLQAARRLLQSNPGATYGGEVPEPLLAIPVLEVELEADGSVRRIHVLRHPKQAQDTVQLAIEAVRRAAPFGSMQHLPRPWKWAEVFLFDDERRFKPRELDR